jgi:hypothetical protein
MSKEKIGSTTCIIGWYWISLKLNFLLRVCIAGGVCAIEIGFTVFNFKILKKPNNKL